MFNWINGINLPLFLQMINLLSLRRVSLEKIILSGATHLLFFV
jgi:hypothetical protein